MCGSVLKMFSVCALGIQSTVSVLSKPRAELPGETGAEFMEIVYINNLLIHLSILDCTRLCG